MMQDTAKQLLLGTSRMTGRVAHARLLMWHHLRGTQQATLQATSTSKGLLTGIRSLRLLARLLTTC